MDYFSKYPPRPLMRKLPAIPETNRGDCCIRFDRKWLPSMRGVLQALLQPGAWDSDTERSTGEASLLLEKLLQVEDTCMDCEAIEFYISEDGHLHFVCNGDDQDLGNVKGEPGRDGQYPPPEPTDENPTPDDLACSAATWITLVIHEHWLDLLDAADTMIDLGDTLAHVVSKILDMLFQYTVIGDEAIDATVELVKGLFIAGVDIIRAFDTFEFQEMLRCRLYCHLLASGGVVGNNWNDAIGPWVNEVAVSIQFAPVAQIYALFLTSISFQWFQLQGRIAAFESHECESCDECVDLFYHKWGGDVPFADNWQIMMYPYQSNQPAGEIYNNGLESRDVIKPLDVTHRQILHARVLLPHAVSITGMRLVYEGTAGFWHVPDIEGWQYIYTPGPGGYMLNIIRPDAWSPSPIEFRNGVWIADEYIDIWFEPEVNTPEQGETTQLVRVTSIEFTGYGSDPFS